ncbi:hypothetical protein [Chthonobacter albigriseus]|uniref:hypothetical protein n=1 Tax=Chthonobacter albigriseus TaxID=1683161 RepID=UPI0015EF6A3F|nr:hypothetical protein [Chthonobacter albigriseus]
MATNATPLLPEQDQLRNPKSVPAELIRAAVLILDVEKAQPDVSRSIQSVLESAASFRARYDAVARLFAPTQQPLAVAFATVAAFGKTGSKLLRKLRRLISTSEKLGLSVPMLLDEIIRSQDEAFGSSPAISDRSNQQAGEALDLDRQVAQGRTYREAVAFSPKDDSSSNALSSVSDVLDVPVARTAPAGAMRDQGKSASRGQVLSSSPTLGPDHGTEPGRDQPDLTANRDADLRGLVTGSKRRGSSKATAQAATHRGVEHESPELQARRTSLAKDGTRQSATGSPGELREPSLFDSQ